LLALKALQREWITSISKYKGDHNVEEEKKEIIYLLIK